MLFRSIFGSASTAGPSAASVSRPASLYEQIAQSLKSAYGDECRLEVALGENFVADAVIQEGEKVAMIEIKTGDSDLPLPASTPSQMADFAKTAKVQFGRQVIPILMTNYNVPEQLKTELENQGVSIFPMRARVAPEKLRVELERIIHR